MARKSRKHLKLAVSVSKDTVGYIRQSVLNRDPNGSVENQRLMIEEWDANTRSLLCVTISKTGSAVNVLTVRHFKSCSKTYGKVRLTALL